MSLFLPWTCVAFLTSVIASLAYSSNIALDLSWTPRTDWLPNPASVCKVTKEGSLLAFEVSEAGRGMKWSASLGEPLNLAVTPWLVVRYRAKNAALSMGYFIWLHGSKGEEQFVADAADFVADGVWHTVVCHANPFVMDTIAVQLQAKRKDARIEISRMEFLANPPKLDISDLIPAGNPLPGKFKIVDITPICNSDSETLVSYFGLNQWPSGSELVASGVPFSLRSGSHAICQFPSDKPWDVHVSLNGAAGTEAFFLIVVMKPDVKSMPPLGEPHLFSVRITYSTGFAEDSLPRRLPSGASLSEGVGVYCVPLIPGKPIKEIVIRANVKGAMVYLVGMTLGVSTQAGPRPAPIREPRPYEAIEMPAGDWAAHQPEEGGRIDFFDGDNRVTLMLDGVTMKMSAAKESGIEASGSMWRVRIDDMVLESRDFVGSLVESQHPYYTIEVADRRGIGVTGTLNVTAQSAGRILTQLQLTTRRQQRIQVDFPLIPSVTHKTADLWYCFPRRGAVINNIPVSLREPYSGLMPLQFMDVFGQNGGLYMIVRDLEATYKYFNLTKDDANRVCLCVEYVEQQVGPGAQFKSAVTEIGMHQGDWHTAVNAYREWLRTWYKPVAPRKEWFRRVFNFRQQFLRFYIPGGENYYNKETKEFTFEKGITEDAKAFGAVDYLHLFDWGASEKWGRTGDYDPWDEIGGVEAFRAAVENTQEAGIPVGLYIEGYLVDPNSRIGQAHGNDWQIFDKEGKPLPFFAPSLNMCSAVIEWQDYLASVYTRVKEQTHAKGYYCDEMGFADPAHFCYAPNHGHEIPEPPLRAQRDLLAKIRKALGPDAALYTEETAADSVTQLLDGSFTYAISSVSDELSPSHINLTRFVLPDFKTFEIIVCDQPLDDRLTAVRQIFFNGEGIWLEGPADKWFAPEVLAFIRKMHGLMRKYEDCFLTLQPVPLVPTGQELVFANEFPGKKRTLWTLFNANHHTISGELLAVEHIPGARYIDVWNGNEIKPRVKGGLDYLALTLCPKDVGCVVRELP